MKELQRAMIPDDENGAVLRRMLDDGDDLTRPRDIDFYFVFADEPRAGAFATAAALRPNLRVSAPEVDEQGVWEVTVTRHMPASHPEISALEQELTDIAGSHTGYPDGWSCMPADEAPSA